MVDEGLPKAVRETVASDQSPVANKGFDDVIQSIKDEYLSEVPDATGQQEQTPEPEQAWTAAEAVQEAIRAASHHRGLTQECPSFWINKNLANCREIRNDTELKCVGLLNTLMQKHGYAFMTNEQLAVWLRMKSAENVRHLLARLSKRGLIQNTGDGTMKLNGWSEQICRIQKEHGAIYSLTTKASSITAHPSPAFR